MAAPNPNEIWQVEVGGQIYEAAFGELGDWINEGSLLPQDKVRKGNLRWIEARRVPTLTPFFNAKEQGLPMPVVVSTTEAPPAPESTDTVPPATADNIPFPADAFPPPPAFISDPIEHSIAVPAEPEHAVFNPDVCAIHTDLASVFLCGGCGNGFCKVCPASYGGSVRICPFCGALCRNLSEIRQKRDESSRRTTAISQGFGLGDFFNALGHPFKFKPSLVFGALMFMVFTLGQSASSIGGIYLMVASIFCLMLANMLTFGVLANTIDKFTHGQLDADFMPSFDDFELWDDVIHPFFLSIGAYLSAFGPLLLVVAVGFYLILSSVTTQMNQFQQSVERIPGSHAYDTERTFNQSKEVKSVVGDLSNKQAARLEEMEEMSALGANTVPPDESVSDRETREQEELWEMAQQGRRQSLESVVGKSPETQAQETEAMVQSFLGLAAPLVVIGAICFLWGLFYFPAACAVAGYTRSFGSAINPLVGLDTIRRLGGTYIKVLLMGLVLLIASGIFATIVGILFAPLDLPGMGNLPAKAIGALFTFFLWVVFSCILGYALFKSSDKLLIGSGE